MPFSLPSLPYAQNALSPVISEETLEFHHGKHHNAYVNNLNGLIDGTEHAGASLEKIITATGSGPIFNNAAQVWNHTFYWESMTPDKGTKPSADLAKAIDAAFDSMDGLTSQFQASAAGNFGSGWTWLVRDAGGTLSLLNTSNAGTPLTTGEIPVMVCDVWEHAYYIDYRNARPDYLSAWWGLINWDTVSARYAAA